MRRAPQQAKGYTAPRGFEIVTPERWHVQACTALGQHIELLVSDVGHVHVNGIALNPHEAKAIAFALGQAATVAARMYVKPRVKVQAHGT